MKRIGACPMCRVGDFYLDERSYRKFAECSICGYIKDVEFGVRVSVAEGEISPSITPPVENRLLTA